MVAMIAGVVDVGCGKVSEGGYGTGSNTTKIAMVLTIVGGG